MASSSATASRARGWPIRRCTTLMSAAEWWRMLKLENLNCGYGSVEAVHDVSFDVPAGSVFALLGPNGAGKTSTITAIMGHVDIHGGRTLLEDVDITYRPAVER